MLALDRLPGEKAFEAPRQGPTSFEELGTFDEVARLTRDWFVRSLDGSHHPAFRIALIRSHLPIFERPGMSFSFAIS